MSADADVFPRNSRPVPQGIAIEQTIAEADKHQRSARLLALLAIAVVSVAHVWIISQGPLTSWPTTTQYYSLLADAFLHGQTSLRIAPNPKLLALPDPYDPAQNEPLRIHDLSLYKGKYYMYWGPVPALLESPLVLIFSRPIGDQYLVFLFVLGIVAMSGMILLTIRRRLFPRAPPWTVALAILIAGLSTPIPVLLARPAIYEAAIAAGQFFLLCGIYCSIRAFANAKPRATLLLLSGSFWAMAVGSRASLAVAVIALTASSAWRACRATSQNVRPQFHFNLPCLLAMGVPLLLGAALLACYNYVRFGNWHEFGQQYQLAAYNLPSLRDRLISLVNVPVNLYAYTFKPLVLSTAMPFVKAVAGAWTYPDWLTLPPDYEALEPVAGIVYCLPFFVLALMPLDTALRKVLRSLRRRRDVTSDLSREHEARGIARQLLLASVLGIAPALGMIGATMRYLADFTPCLILLAVLGLWHGLEVWPQLRRRLLILALVLGAYSIAVGIQLPMSSYYRHLHSQPLGY